MSVNLDQYSLTLQGTSGTTLALTWFYKGSPVSKKVYKKSKKKTFSEKDQIGTFKYYFQYALRNSNEETDEEFTWYPGDSNTNYPKSSVTTAGKYKVLYTAPSEAIKVRAMVKMTSATYQNKNNKKTPFFKGTKDTGWIPYEFSSNPPDTPPAPTVTISQYKLTVSLTTTDTKAKKVKFEIYNGNTLFEETTLLDILWPAGNVEYPTKITPGGTYRVRCKTYDESGLISSQYSPWSGDSNTIPTTPTGLVVSAQSNDTIRADWNSVSGISAENGYEIEWTNDKNLFGSSTGVTSATTSNNWYIIGSSEITQGYVYYFRVRAKNEQGNSPWSEIKSQTVAETPEKPTTWSEGSSYKVGDTVKFYWTHNATDESKMTSAVIHYKINGVDQTEITYTPPASTEENPIYSYDMTSLLSSCSDGDVVLWKIKTKGVAVSYSEWSIEREIKFYGTPTLVIAMPSTVSSYPFNISLSAGPSTQTALAYSVSIISQESYSAYDEVGESVYVTAGSTIYSKTFINVTNSFSIPIKAEDAVFNNGETYTVNVTVAMDSGLTVDSTTEFSVSWSGGMLLPDCDIEIDEDNYIAKITPFCFDPDAGDAAYIIENTVSATITSSTFISRVVYKNDYDFIYRNSQWTLNGTAVNMSQYGITVSGVPVSGDVIRVTYGTNPVLLSGTYIDIYRVNANGTFTPIMKNISNNRTSIIIDPHPSLRNGSYRIIARRPSTNAYGFNDVSYTIEETSIIMQWNELYSSGYMTNDEDSWYGYILKLPYNVDLSESNEKDVSLVEYIGRKYPVSYYGTQLGYSISLSADIEKSDDETLSLIRKLATWQGNVYVREPSGGGYWANISISFNRNHNTLTIPVSITVKHVDVDER